MLARMRLIAAVDAVPESYARVDDPGRAARRPFRVGAVQHRWHPEPAEHELAVREGAQLVCLQELTLSPYFASTPDGVEAARERAEAIPDGPTSAFAARVAAETGAYGHASLYERPDDGGPLGYNTAI